MSWAAAASSLKHMNMRSWWRKFHSASSASLVGGFDRVMVRRCGQLQHRLAQQLDLHRAASERATVSFVPAYKVSAMTSPSQLTSGLLALSLAGLLSACGNAIDSAAAPKDALQSQAVANDCRAPTAQSTQRGCRPVTRTLGSL